MKTTKLSRDQINALQAELDAIYEEHRKDLGEKDAQYIHRLIAFKRWSEIAARSMLMFGVGPMRPFTWVPATLLLTASKIIARTEIGHNVLHGQYDWMNDPSLDSRYFDWDSSVTSESWKHSHNVEHHNHTNIIGRDRDLGYGVLRITEGQDWKERYKRQAVVYLIMLFTFEVGIGVYDAGVDTWRDGKISTKEFLRRSAPFWRKAGRKYFKEFGAYPALGLLTGSAGAVLAGNLASHVLMQAWINIVIFCGHFTENTKTYAESDLPENETRGDWYLRQIEGSSNFTGPLLVHILSGHLSCQIEHHLFPDLPSYRYRAISPRVQAICKKYGIQYNSGSLIGQYAGVVKRIVRMSRPLEQDRALAQAA